MESFWHCGRWSDVDFEKKVVWVRRTVDYIPHHGYVENAPKTVAGHRAITLADFVLEKMKKHRTRQLEEKLHVGSDWEDRNLVFTDLTGGYFNPGYLSKTFPKLMREMGLPSIRFHDLRHSAATLLLVMGVPMKVVQDILGHSSYMITADIYGHVVPSQQPQAMQHWDDVFQSDKQGDEHNQTDDRDDDEPPGELVQC